MIEEIGKIKLDYSRYPGEDLYCDGAVEDELLEIAQKYSKVEFPGIIKERASWPILYHLSALRENIVEWIPMNSTEKVLEIGAGCGAITGALSRKSKSVTCVDLSKKRSQINAYRNMDCENITIHVGNFQDIEPDLPADFDYIFLIGVFEYGQSYIGTDKPYENFLNCIKKHLAPGGKIVIAIENKLGLKYFAGCKEDHLGSYFSGIENYKNGDGVRTFTKKGLENIFKACEMKDYSFYYPYPDYKFMTTIFSDDYLPCKGELCNNTRNFDRDRMLLFDEKSAFDGIIEDNLFPVFSNSYLVILGEKPQVQYARYSNDRAREYAIRTEILTDSEGIRKVRKSPLTLNANDHIRNMFIAYEQLQNRYEESGLEVNRCALIEENERPIAQFEYIEGITLTQLLDECLKKEDMSSFQKLFQEYFRKISFGQEKPVSNFDLAFSNILINNNQWTMIDYEWTFGKEIEPKELAFRALYCYLLEDEARDSLNLEMLLEDLDITEEKAQSYREQEMEFQKFVTGKECSMAEIRNLIGYRIMCPQKWVENYSDSGEIERVQIYEDMGDGYKEEQSYFLKDAFEGNGKIRFSIEVSGNVKMLRIDPVMDSCIVKVCEITWNSEPIPIENKKVMLINGKRIKGGTTLLFPTQDPNINLNLENLKKQPNNFLAIEMDITRIPLDMATDMALAVKKIF